jgi:hypothetical protein
MKATMDATRCAVDALRAAPPELDDLTRTRIERVLTEASRAGTVVAPAAPQAPAASPRWAIGGGALAAAAAAAIAWWGAGGAESPSVEPVRVEAPAVAQLRVESSLVAEGMPAQGETLRTGAGQRVSAHLGGTSVELEPNTRAQFERIASEELRVRLRQGAVRIAFHPEKGSGQRMAVVTPAARVEVVGTVFRVEVDGENATGVSVESGKVRVVPESPGQESQLLRRGQTTRVEAIGPMGADDEAAELQVDEAAGAEEQSAESDAPWEEGAPAVDPDPSHTAPAPSTHPPRPRARPKARDSSARRGIRGQVTLPGDNVSPEVARARDLLNQQRYEEARKQLRAVADSTSKSLSERTGAWIMIAESYEEERAYAKAGEAYGKASWFGSRTAAGQRALFRLARLREGRLGDAHGARTAYERYLRDAPHGPDAPAARAALCRLGDCQ